MNNAQMAKAFNEWMRRYTEDPDAFEREFVSVNSFLAEASDGREPTYGETCSAYMQKLASEVPAD